MALKSYIFKKLYPDTTNPAYCLLREGDKAGKIIRGPPEVLLEHLYPIKTLINEVPGNIDDVACEPGDSFKPLELAELESLENMKARGIRAKYIGIRHDDTNTLCVLNMAVKCRGYGIFIDELDKEFVLRDKPYISVIARRRSREDRKYESFEVLIMHDIQAQIAADEIESEIRQLLKRKLPIEISSQQPPSQPL